MSQAGMGAPTATFPTGHWRGPALVAMSLAAAIIVFWPGFLSLVDAWAVPEYSHGPIIPLISTFLFLREMRRVPPAPVRAWERWPGVVVVLFGLSIGVLGNVAAIEKITTYGFIVWAAGMMLTSFGVRRGLLFWPAVVHLAFMLPLPQFIYWQTSTFLQFVSSEIGVWLIAAMGIPVYLDGNVIDLGTYKLLVAEACSGLRYLFPMLSFSFVFAVLYQGPRWHKVVLLLSAAPITVLMNSFRIGVIGVMVDNFGIEHAEGFLHTFEGWVIFVACVLILFGEAVLLQRLTRDPRPLSETLDIAFEGLGQQAARLRDVRASAAMATAAAVTLGVAAFGALAPERTSPIIEREPLALFPSEIGGWEGRRGAPLDRGIEAVLGADDYLTMSFTGDGAAAPVDLFIAYYFDQTDGEGIHSPEVCIPAGGWEVSAWSTRVLTDANGVAAPVNRAVIQRGLSRQLVYFWFDLRGERIADDYQAKFANLWDSATIGRSDGALLRLITPLREGETEADADARLTRFFRETADVMPRFLPE